MTPTEIALGRSDAYWLHGNGLSGVTAVFLGSVGCRFEGYDDTRLVIYSPEHVPELVADGMLKIQAIGSAGNGEFDVYCRLPETPVPLPIDPGEQRYPMILGIDPTSVGMAGGQVQVSGANFTMATRLLLGEVECQVSNVSESALDRHRAGVRRLRRPVPARLCARPRRRRDEHRRARRHDHDRRLTRQTVSFAATRLKTYGSSVSCACLRQSCQRGPP